MAGQHSSILLDWYGDVFGLDGQVSSRELHTTQSRTPLDFQDTYRLPMAHAQSPDLDDFGTSPSHGQSVMGKNEHSKFDEGNQKCER